MPPRASLRMTSYRPSLRLTGIMRCHRAVPLRKKLNLRIGAASMPAGRLTTRAARYRRMCCRREPAAPDRSADHRAASSACGRCAQTHCARSRAWRRPESPARLAGCPGWNWRAAPGGPSGSRRRSAAPEISQSLDLHVGAVEQNARRAAASSVARMRKPVMRPLARSPRSRPDRCRRAPPAESPPAARGCESGRLRASVICSRYSPAGTSTVSPGCACASASLMRILRADDQHRCGATASAAGRGAIQQAEVQLQRGQQQQRRPGSRRAATAGPADQPAARRRRRSAPNAGPSTIATDTLSLPPAPIRRRDQLAAPPPADPCHPATRSAGSRPTSPGRSARRCTAAARYPARTECGSTR